MAHRTANTPSNSSVLSSCLFLSVMETCIKIPYSNYSIPIRPFWILRFDSKRDFTSWTLSVAKKAVAKLMQMVQRSSYDAAKLKYEGCSRAAKLRKMHCSSVVCSCAQLKNIHPLRTDFWPEGKHFIFGNSQFFFIFGEIKAAVGGEGVRSAQLGVSMCLKRRVAGSARARKGSRNPLVDNNGILILKLFF